LLETLPSDLKIPHHLFIELEQFEGSGCHCIQARLHMILEDPVLDHATEDPALEFADIIFEGTGGEVFGL